MSESKNEAPETGADADPDVRGEPAAQEETFALPDPAQVESTKLRRRLFGGYRHDDVASALRTREEQIAELRRDVAALWLAFGQHERTIREMLVALERLTGVGVDPPGARAAEPREPARGDATHDTSSVGTTGGPDAIRQQLGDLDQVLGTIEEATQSLERTYHDEIVARAEGAETGGDRQREDAGGGTEDAGEEPGGGASGQGADETGDEAGEERPAT